MSEKLISPKNENPNQLLDLDDSSFPVGKEAGRLGPTRKRGAQPGNCNASRPDQPRPAPAKHKRGAQPGNCNASRPDQPRPDGPKRKPGAQPGNQNARTFGLFSKSFTPEEIHALEHDEIGGLQDDFHLLNIIITRVTSSLEFSQMTPEQKLSALRALTNVIARKESLLRTQRLLYNSQTTVERAIAELSFIPPEQD